MCQKGHHWELIVQTGLQEEIQGQTGTWMNNTQIFVLFLNWASCYWILLMSQISEKMYVTSSHLIIAKAWFSLFWYLEELVFLLCLVLFLFYLLCNSITCNSLNAFLGIILKTALSHQSKAYSNWDENNSTLENHNPSTIDFMGKRQKYFSNSKQTQWHAWSKFHHY